MRSLAYILASIGEAIIIALLVIFVVENMRAVRYTFLGASFPGNVWWTVAGSALLGFLFALLLLGPLALLSASRGRSLNRARARGDQDLARLRIEHEQLKTQYAQVTSERDQYRARLAATYPAAPRQPAAAPPDTGRPAPSTAPREAPEAPEAPYPGHAVPPNWVQEDWNAPPNPQQPPIPTR